MSAGARPNWSRHRGTGVLPVLRASRKQPVQTELPHWETWRFGTLPLSVPQSRPTRSCCPGGGKGSPRGTQQSANRRRDCFRNEHQSHQSSEPLGTACRRACWQRTRWVSSWGSFPGKEGSSKIGGLDMSYPRMLKCAQEGPCHRWHGGSRWPATRTIIIGCPSIDSADRNAKPP